MKKKKKYKQPAAPLRPAIVAVPASSTRMKFIGLFLIILVTFIAYLPVLKAGFVNWDDPDYINNNALIKHLSNLKLLITQPVQGNYHPLTMISLAINYSISGMDAWSYHLFNLLFHLFNCFLVYRLTMLLSKGNTIIAFTTAVLFAIHPMHVESVAWVSERKDVLYGIFFLAGLISYTKYVDTGSKKQYWVTVLLLVLSLLSKPAAVIFPLVLFCIDLLRKRRLNFKLIIEKIPFILPALACGWLAYLGQQENGATGGAAVFDMGSRVLMGFYGIMMYIIKLIAPFNLSTFYPFPPINEKLPTAYFVAPLLTVALAILVFYSLKKKRIVAFGILFYLTNLLLVLQIQPVGSAVIADRYTYIPYIGLFYIIGSLVDRYTKGKTIKAWYILAPVSLVLSIMTYNQASTWISSASLWDHAIKTQPSARAYDHRADVFFMEDKDYDQAITYYGKAIEINIADNEAYNHRGNLYFDQNKSDLAYSDFKKALSIKPDDYTAMDNLGALFGLKSQYDSALHYFNMALALNPNYLPSYKNRGLALTEMNHKEEAIKDFNKVLQYEPDNPDIYNIIGDCFRSLGKYPEALTAINKAISLKPDPHFYLNRSYCYSALKEMDSAKRDALTAKQAGLPLDSSYARTLGIP